MDAAAHIAALHRCVNEEDAVTDPAPGNGWNEWKRHVLACLETLAEQGAKREEQWQTDHDSLNTLCEQTKHIDSRLQLVEEMKRESRTIDLIEAVVIAVLGYLGIRYGGAP